MNETHTMNNICGKNDINLAIAKFLGLLWGFYVSDKPLHYEIFCINDKGGKIVEFSHLGASTSFLESQRNAP